MDEDEDPPRAYDATSFCNNPDGRSGDASRSPTPPAGWVDRRSTHFNDGRDTERGSKAVKEFSQSFKENAALGGAYSICVLDT